MTTIVNKVGSKPGADLTLIKAFLGFAFAYYGLPMDAATLYIEPVLADQVRVMVAQALKEDDGRLTIKYNYDPGDSHYAVMEAIAHEATHISQLYKGQLDYVLLTCPVKGLFWGFKWEGEAYLPPATEEEYLAAPWEQDPIDNAPVMINLFIKHPDIVLRDYGYKVEYSGLNLDSVTV